MTEASLQQFVEGALAGMGVEARELAPGVGVWRAHLPEAAARFLGRAHPELLYSFDLNRWEEGARLECLSALSPLVQRLRSYVLARGGCALAHVPDEGGAGYRAYVMASFGARFQSDHAVETGRWLAVDLESGSPVKVKGDPLATPGLVEGAPVGVDADAARPAARAALAQLTDHWNREAAQEARNHQRQVEQRYETEAAEIVRATVPGSARDRAIHRLSERLRLTAECRLDMALLMWLPERTASR